MKYEVKPFVTYLYGIVDEEFELLRISYHEPCFTREVVDSLERSIRKNLEKSQFSYLLKNLVISYSGIACCLKLGDRSKVLEAMYKFYHMQIDENKRISESMTPEERQRHKEIARLREEFDRLQDEQPAAPTASSSSEPTVPVASSSSEPSAPVATL